MRSAFIFYLFGAFSYANSFVLGSKLQRTQRYDSLASARSSDYKNLHLLHASSSKSSSAVEGSSPPPWLPAFGVAALGGLLFGSDIGSSSSVVRILGEGQSSLGVLSSLELGQVASASLAGAMIASAALIVVGDKDIGRKQELQIASTLFTIGTVVQSFSPSYPLIIAGRLIYGLGIGTAMHVAPLYIAETAPNDMRGKLVSLKEAAIVSGIVLGYGAGAVFGQGDGEAWRSVYESVLPLEAMMLIGAFAVAPQSPRWLAL